LSCAAPTVAVVHGEGGSGGALAGATCDLVLVTPDSWFAALSPEGAAAALRRSPQEAADLMRVTPGDLVDDGFADAIVPADPTELRDCVARALGRVRAMDPVVRRKQRHQRWSGPLRRAH
jgi:acyl-CoA carboxylase subunit beta